MTSSGWQTRTDCQIMAFGDHLMRLYDDEGETLVTARRPALGEPWAITGGGASLSAEDRPAAIEAMKNRALEILGVEGLSTLIPFGLTEMP